MKQLLEIDGAWPASYGEPDTSIYYGYLLGFDGIREVNGYGHGICTGVSQYPGLPGGYGYGLGHAGEWKSDYLTVTPGESYTIVVGAGATWSSYTSRNGFVLIAFGGDI